MFSYFCSFSDRETTTLVDSTIQIVKSGKLPNSPIQIPFKIPLNVTNSSLFETYHGVDVSIEYSIRDEVNLIFFKKKPQQLLFYILSIKQIMQI